MSVFARACLRGCWYSQRMNVQMRRVPPQCTCQCLLFLYMHICLRMNARGLVNPDLCACIPVCVRACVRECMRVCVRACVRACVCVCVYVSVCVCVCVCNTSVELFSQ